VVKGKIYPNKSRPIAYNIVDFCCKYCGCPACDSIRFEETHNRCLKCDRHILLIRVDEYDRIAMKTLIGE
jgi:hypothetical protein